MNLQSESAVMEPPAEVAPEAPRATPASDSHDRVIVGALAVFLLFISRIAMAQAAYAVALLAFVLKTRARRWKIEWPAPMLPVAAFAVLTVASCLLSADPLGSLTRTREFVLYGILVVVANTIGRPALERLVHVLFASTAVLAVWGIAQYARMGPIVSPSPPRITGPMSHWMTYSGLLVLAASMAMAYAVFHPSRRRRVIYGALSLLCSVTLVLTLTRGAYLALIAALALLSLLRRPAWLLALPPLIALTFALAPRPAKDRILSLFDLHDTDDTAVDRLYLWRSGLGMIADHPVLGVGLSMVPTAYLDSYRDPHAPKPRNNHLHSNVLQVAAERGIPALLAWLWLHGVLAGQAVRRLRACAGRPDPALAGCLLAFTAFHVFGLVEYNFGDSEVLMLLLFLCSIPFIPEDGPSEPRSSGCASGRQRPFA